MQPITFMNDRQKYRLLIALVLGLALLNVALLLWFGPFRHGRREGQRPGERLTFLTRQLDFTEEQRQQYHALRERYFVQRRTLAEGIRPMRKHFFGQLSDTTTSDSVLLVQAQQYHTQLARIDLLTLRHFQQVAVICTPEQRIKLATIVQTLPQAAAWNNRRSGPAGRRQERLNQEGPGQERPGQESSN
jgi:Spy/CpxP family protein refolding chaperone